MFFSDYSEIEDFLDNLYYTPAVYSYQATNQESVIALCSDFNNLEIDGIHLSSDFTHAKVKTMNKDSSSESSERDQIS
jgi:hypothetical protein